LPFTSTVGCEGADDAAPLLGGVRKYVLLSCCQIVSSTPDVYLPGCSRTASIPALRSTE
jgi:hypothetical protein